MAPKTLRRLDPEGIRIHGFSRNLVMEFGHLRDMTSLRIHMADGSWDGFPPSLASCTALKQGRGSWGANAGVHQQAHALHSLLNLRVDEVLIPQPSEPRLPESFWHAARH